MESIVDYVVYVIPESTGWLSELATFLSAIASLASVCIACLALWFSRTQMKMHEQHNRLMATPHLSGWSHVDNSSGTFIYTLENTGLGPVIVSEVTLLVDGVQQEGEGTELIDKAVQNIFEPNTFDYGAEMFTVGEFIPTGKKFNLVTIEAKNKSAEEVRTYITDKITLLITYKSILGDSYLFNSAVD